jgi:Rab-GTPase-TBC domain
VLPTVFLAGIANKHRFWGFRHPASGYVQGINDLVTPFLAVFLSEHSSAALDGDALPDDLPESLLLGVEVRVRLSFAPPATASSLQEPPVEVLEGFRARIQLHMRDEKLGPLCLRDVMAWQQLALGGSSQHIGWRSGHVVLG